MDNEGQIDLLPDNLVTLTDAKYYVGENMARPGGITCPCCHQHVQMYKRSITSSMAYGLKLFSQSLGNNTDVSKHAENFFKEQKGLPASVRGDFSKLRFWGLIEPGSVTKGEGFYRMTWTGIGFTYGTILVKRNAIIFNNKLVTLSGPEINIKQCLKNKFSYDKLMKGEQ